MSVRQWGHYVPARAASGGGGGGVLAGMVDAKNVIIWEECLRIPASRLAEEPSLVHRHLMTSPKPCIVTGVFDAINPKDAMSIGIGWASFKEVETSVPISKVVKQPDWRAKCPFASSKDVPCGREPVGKVVDRILKGEALRIMHAQSGEKNARGNARAMLSILSGFEPFVNLPLRSESQMMYINGVGGITGLHYDREGNTNLHFCFAGTKRIIYMDHDQKHALLKNAITSNSRFRPELRHDPEYLSNFGPIRACDITLSAGEMLYMPQRSWHYMEYSEPSASVTVAFYMDEASKRKNVGGPEELSWFLLTNERDYFPFAPWLYFTLVLRVPVSTLAFPYLAGYPLVMALLSRRGMCNSLSVLEAANDALRLRLIHPVNIVLNTLIGSTKRQTPRLHVWLSRALAVATVGAVGAQVVRNGILTARGVAAAIAAYHVVVGGTSACMMKIAFPDGPVATPATSPLQRFMQYILI